MHCGALKLLHYQNIVAISLLVLLSLLLLLLPQFLWLTGSASLVCVQEPTASLVCVQEPLGRSLSPGRLADTKQGSLMPWEEKRMWQTVAKEANQVTLRSPLFLQPPTSHSPILLPLLSYCPILLPSVSYASVPLPLYLHATVASAPTLTH